MRKAAREIGFAFLAWLVPFAASVCIFPLKRSHPPLFDSLMGLVLAGSTVVLCCVYLRGALDKAVYRAALAGVLWVAANWLLDGLMFCAGPMKMSLAQYAEDIGAAYLMVPIITTGLGAAAASSGPRMGSAAGG
jgi:hypothetical protein